MKTLLLEFSVVALGVLLLLVDAFNDRTNKNYISYFGALGLAGVLALSFLPQINPLADGPTAAFISIDPGSTFFVRFLLIATIIVVLMTPSFVPVLERYVPAERKGGGVAEFAILPIFSCAGLMWMVRSVDFIMIFVALELATITLYILVTYLRQNQSSLEAGTKYLILGALSTGFLVYGISWIFGVTGTTNLALLPQAIASLPSNALLPLLFGIALIFVALSFKIAAFPCCPDSARSCTSSGTRFGSENHGCHRAANGADSHFW